MSMATVSGLLSVLVDWVETTREAVLVSTLVVGGINIG